jgi:hypothetical protein
MRLISTLIAAVALTASAAWAGAPAAAPGPVQVWNCGQWQTISAGDLNGVNPQMKSLKPVSVIGARNGVCSGRLVLTRDNGPIIGLKVAVTDLSHVNGKGKIPAARLQVRYADRAVAGKSWMPPHRYDRLLEKAPAQIPAVPPIRARGFRLKFEPRNKVPVATVPVWITVRVPADAVPGGYRGEIAISAAALSPNPVKLPFRLKVHAWTMPDPKNFRVRTIGWMNPEALAAHYGVKLWSDRHFELMGRSMEMMLELGSRHLPLDISKNYPARGNADTMIKWVKQPDGSYKYDFTLFDRYCDLAAEKIGKPFPVRLNIWRGPRNGGGGEKDDYENAVLLVLDPGSKEVSELLGPKKLGSPEMKAFWEPVMKEMRARLEKRGWFAATGTNWMCYCGGMTKEMASMVRSIWPDGKWTDVTHGRVRRYRTLEKDVFAPVFVQSTVWNEGTLDKYIKWKSGPYPRQYAEKFNPATAWCTHARNQYREQSWPTLWTVRTRHETAILKGNDGLENVGADHFPVKDARGRYRPGPWSAYAQGPKNGTIAILGAGANGPIGTERFEALREGIQLSEAMVFIQKTLEAKKINGELGARANKLLDDRAKAMVACRKTRMITVGKKQREWAYFDLGEYAKGAAERDDALYAMAAEVYRKTGGK